MKHELLEYATTGAWGDILWGDSTPLQDHLHPDAVALFLDSINTGTPKRVGFRKKGSTHPITYDCYAECHQLAVVGLDADKRAEGYRESSLTQKLYAEGAMLACGGVLFTNPIEKTPDGNLAWVTIDLAAECPGAKGILAEVGREPGGITTGIRKHGSTDARTETAYHCWPVIGCDENQKIDFFARDYGGYKNRLWILGYIKGMASFNTNAPDITPAIIGSYQTVIVPPPGKLIFLEITLPGTGLSYALRSKGAVYDQYNNPNYMHNWAMVPANAAGEFEAKIEHALFKIYHIGEGH